MMLPIVCRKPQEPPPPEFLSADECCTMFWLSETGLSVYTG